MLNSEARDSEGCTLVQSKVIEVMLDSTARALEKKTYSHTRK